MAKRTICYVTGTRADFGLMRRSLLALNAHPSWRVELAATGMHYDAEFGNTVEELRSSGLFIAAEVPTVRGARSGVATSQAIADALLGFARAWSQRKPDLVLLLGDRGEMLAAAVAAAQLGLPIAHVHGGERSGTLDEPTRHAISKFATLHWVATQESADRLVRMGEEINRISVIGAPGLDGLLQDAQMGERDFERWLIANWQMPIQRSRFLLVLIHPEASESAVAASQTQELAKALRSLNAPVLWLKPNADSGSAGIQKELQVLAESTEARLQVVTHLSRPMFCAAMKNACVMLGNSSSGIIEAASFGTPVVNIGTRQRLRQRSDNIVDVDWIQAAIVEAADSAMRIGRYAPNNVYGQGQSAASMLAALDRWTAQPEAIPLEKLNAY